MGTKAAVGESDLRWLSPTRLWAGILAGPIAWACNLTTSYAVVKPVCRAQSDVVFNLITAGSLAVVLAGATLAFAALSQTAGDTGTDGGRPRQRARFMAVVGLSACALFALQILAGAIPHWMLDACL